MKVMNRQVGRVLFKPCLRSIAGAAACDTACQLSSSNAAENSRSTGVLSCVQFRSASLVSMHMQSSVGSCCAVGKLTRVMQQVCFKPTSPCSGCAEGRHLHAVVAVRSPPLPPATSFTAALLSFSQCVLAASFVCCDLMVIRGSIHVIRRLDLVSGGSLNVDIVSAGRRRLSFSRARALHDTCDAPRRI